MEKTGPKHINSETWIAYVAGYIDGEGCLRFKKGSPEIQIVNTYPFVLHLIAETFGGKVKQIPRRNGHRIAFTWRIYGENAVKCIHQITPYLWEKLAQADLILRIRAMTPSPRRDALIAQLSTLKNLEYGKEACSGKKENTEEHPPR